MRHFYFLIYSFFNRNFMIFWSIIMVFSIRVYFLTNHWVLTLPNITPNFTVFWGKIKRSCSNTYCNFASNQSINKQNSITNFVSTGTTSWPDVCFPPSLFQYAFFLLFQAPDHSWESFHVVPTNRSLRAYFNESWSKLSIITAARYFLVSEKVKAER